MLEIQESFHKYIVMDVFIGAHPFLVRIHFVFKIIPAEKSRFESIVHPS